MSLSLSPVSWAPLNWACVFVLHYWLLLFSSFPWKVQLLLFLEAISTVRSISLNSLSCKGELCVPLIIPSLIKESLMCPEFHVDARFLSNGTDIYFHFCSLVLSSLKKNKNLSLHNLILSRVTVGVMIFIKHYYQIILFQAILLATVSLISHPFAPQGDRKKTLPSFLSPLVRSLFYTTSMLIQVLFLENQHSWKPETLKDDSSVSCLGIILWISLSSLVWVSLALLLPPCFLYTVVGSHMTAVFKTKLVL